MRASGKKNNGKKNAQVRLKRRSAKARSLLTTNSLNGDCARGRTATGSDGLLEAAGEEPLKESKHNQVVNPTLVQKDCAQPETDGTN